MIEFVCACVLSSGRSCAVGPGAVSKGGISHTLQKAVSGNRWSETPLHFVQPGGFCAPAALGVCALCHYGGQN